MASARERGIDGATTGQPLASGAASSGARPVLFDPTALLLSPLAVLGVRGRRRKRSWLAWSMAGVFLAVALLGLGAMLAEGLNPPAA